MGKSLFDCTGKVTMVNGGIGFGFASGVAKQGGDIAIWARNAKKNAAAQKALLEFGARRVETYIVDVASEQAIVEGYDRLLADFGRIDCVFANSGGPPLFTSVFDMPTSAWHEFLGVALHGAFFTLREGARHMVNRAEAGELGGSLVACGSTTMFQGIAGLENYAASKAAVGAIVRCMAVEFGKYQIRANIVVPGITVTPMTGGEAAAKTISEAFSPVTPLGRPAYPEDFEGIGAFLCSDASAFMSGETVMIDGGYIIRP